MSAFRVTITVGEGDLGKVLSGLTRQQIAEANIVPVKNEPEPGVQRQPIRGKKCPTGRAAGAAVIMKGDRTDNPTGPGGLRTIMTIHETLESKKGIGTVTRAQLTSAAKSKLPSFRSGHITKLIVEGFLVYV